MAHIVPFKGILYNPEKIKDLSKVVAPPYDIISSEARNRYYQIHEYNIIRLILPDSYSQAADFLKDWLEEGILKEDPEPAIYIYEQEFSLKGQKKKRRGFIAAMKLEPYETGKVLPHEKTFPEPKLDRLKLLRACQANFSQVFGLYPDEGEMIRQTLDLKMKDKPIIDIVDENKEIHRLWRVTQEDSLNQILKEMEDRPIFIADGHHRYGAALTYKNEMKGEGPWDYVMMGLIDMDDPGLSILPTHRVVRGVDTTNIQKKISEFFVVKVLESKDRLFAEMDLKGKIKHVLGMYQEGKYFLLTLKDENIMDKIIKEDKPKEWKRLEVTILHTLLIEHILGLKGELKEKGPLAYVKDAEEAIADVNEGKYQLALFLNPTKINQVKSIASQREMMPQKSTFFYPKLLSGLVLRKL